MQRTTTAKWLLIIALAFVFACFGVDKFIHPDIWIVWMPLWMDGLMGQPTNTWLLITGASEVLFALLLFIPIRRVQQIGVILVALHLVAVLTQVGWNDIGIRDIGLLISSIALFFLL